MGSLRSTNKYLQGQGLGWGFPDSTATIQKQFKVTEGPMEHPGGSERLADPLLVSVASSSRAPTSDMEALFLTNPQESKFK